MSRRPFFVFAAGSRNARRDARGRTTAYYLLTFNWSFAHCRPKFQSICDGV